MKPSRRESKPRRYVLKETRYGPAMEEVEGGGWVKWADYCSLLAKIKRMRLAGDMLAYHVNGRDAWSSHPLSDEWVKASTSQPNYSEEL